MFGKKKNKDKSPFKYIDLRHIDSDNDGLSDYDEINIYGTDPSDPDTNHDGINDGEDVRQGFNPTPKEKIKNLFIPRAQNNYQPKILQPKRLAFYGLSAIAMKVIIVGLVLFVPITAFLTPDILGQESKKVIVLTNKIRTNLAKPVVRENRLLDQAAYDKVQDMLLKQYFAHVGPDSKDLSFWLKSVGYKYDVAGENLALGFANASDVVNAWTKSPTHYANLIDSDFAEIGVSMVAGSYNNIDTTLVAQYFGSSSQPAPAVTEPSPAPVIEPKPQPQVTTEKTVATTAKPATQNEKLGIKTNTVKQAGLSKVAVTNVPESKVVQTTPVATETKPIPAKTPAIEPVSPLVEPIFITPVNNSSLAKKSIELKFSCPQAEKVLVYLDNNLVKELTKTDTNQFSLTFDLTDGPHKFILKSYRGDDFKVSEPLYITIDTSAPLVDINQSKIILLEPIGQGEKIIKAVAYLSDDAKKAEVTLGNYRITLAPQEAIVEGKREWAGQILVFEDEQKDILKTITMPVLTVQDEFGNSANIDILWENILPVQPSLMKQYFFVKSYPSKYIDWLFNITGWYYQLILIIAILALLLNIFVEIRKQYPKVILSTLGFIFLLLVLITV